MYLFLYVRALATRNNDNVTELYCCRFLTLPQNSDQTLGHRSYLAVYDVFTQWKLQMLPERWESSHSTIFMMELPSEGADHDGQGTKLKRRGRYIC